VAEERSWAPAPLRPKVFAAANRDELSPLSVVGIPFGTMFRLTAYSPNVFPTLWRFLVDHEFEPIFASASGGLFH
jgi:hypothetical protein